MGKYKLSQEQIKEMMDLLAQGESKYQVAKDFGVCRKTVYNLVEKIKGQKQPGIDWELLRKEYK